MCIFFHPELCLHQDKVCDIHQLIDKMILLCHPCKLKSDLMVCNDKNDTDIFMFLEIRIHTNTITHRYLKPHLKVCSEVFVLRSPFCHCIMNVRMLQHILLCQYSQYFRNFLLGIHPVLFKSSLHVCFSQLLHLKKF